MSVTGKRIVGVPTLILYEAEGCTALVQTRDGSIFRGMISEVEDNWNLNMKTVIMKAKGSDEEIPFSMLYIRGAQIEFIVLPEMCVFKHSPLFQRVLEYKKGNTAPKVQPDMALRLARRHSQTVVFSVYIH
ncbi:small nuclear ribonucleoprotein Sm D3 [Blastocystis sp. ATCC 50177/Nand II]|uniref:Small nuclear ribonucleoprotein Sm D3 n=1 Tax=Blastocystis sp. subtype 1 (strain ATCC 50177 / NandII) TaxID=478820 RepID=A0A196SG40_BLAHN|nr:small nuclear ribonucleoprotein Sm D3 [Blastocystis sp. ATCC 50177/Nand II]